MADIVTEQNDESPAPRPTRIPRVRRPRAVESNEAGESNITHIGATTAVQPSLLPLARPEVTVTFLNVEDFYCPSFEPDPSLVKSISDLGVLEPIQVSESQVSVGGARYFIKKGRHRLMAARAAGIELVPCVVSGIDLETPLVRLVLKHRQRENLAAEYEAVEALLKILAADGLAAYREVSRATGLSTAGIRECLSLRALIEPLMLALQDGKILGKIALRCATFPEDIQRQLADILERTGNLTGKDIRAVRDAGAAAVDVQQSSVQFVKWRPIVEEVREALESSVNNADQDARSESDVENLIVACHEAVRQLTALLGSGDDVDE